MQKKNVVELIIGYHQLEGQLVPLKKPLAMLEKVPEECGTGSTATCYQVCSFLTKRLSSGIKSLQVKQVRVEAYN